MDIELKDLQMTGVIVSGSGSSRLRKFPAKINLSHLRGRCNLAILSRERLLVAKLDGWPEVSELSLHSELFVKLPLFNIQIHLGVATTSAASGASNEVMEIAKELAVSAIRGSQVTVNMEDFSTGNKPVFPVFFRKTRTPSVPPVKKELKKNKL